MSRVDSDRSAMRRALRLASVLLVAFLASGCAKLVYNRLDSLAGWYLGSLVSLDAEQRGDLRDWLSRMLEWHRSSELGRYVEFLQTLDEQLAAPGDRATYERVESQVEAFGLTVVKQASPDAARLLMRLSDEQLNELDANMEERALERAQESRKAQQSGAWRKERERDLRRQLKRWTGEATEEQVRFISQAVAQYEPTSEDWVDSQRQWRKLLIETLRARPANEQRILQLLLEPNAHWTPAYSTKNERNRARSLALLEQLDASLTSDQRAHLRREVQQLAEQLQNLRES